MVEMYKRIDDLCKANGTNVTAMCKELNIARSSLSELNRGRTKSLSYEYISKIANHFGVSPDYVAGKTDIKEKTPTLTEKDERDIKKKIDDLLNMMSSQKGLMFDGDPLTPEALESIKSAMILGMTAATLKNKEKYNPNKNKKASTNGRDGAGEKVDKKI